MNALARRVVSATVLLACAQVGCLAEPTRQLAIPRIEQMPNLPQPYEMRNWNKVARDYDALVFDFDRQGQFLPVIRRHEAPGSTGEPVFALDTYVGWASEGYETINCLGAVSGATAAGVDKSDQDGRDWVQLCANYFTERHGLNLYLNNPNDKTGNSFWYELFPSVLFSRIYCRYPDTEDMERQFRLTADRWFDACVAMGGKVRAGTVPDFDHTAFDFINIQPVDNGVWKEADAAAAIAWLEYMAYVKTGERKYLTAAQWGLQFLEEARENPYYEVLMPLGAYLAARMNAEQGTDYDVEKLVNWCFDASNRRKWGASAGKWGDLDCSGLIGSVVSDSGDYAFAMNTFEQASSLVPLVRYDERFARAIGKWMLNAANSARLFYANGLPADQQTDADWSQRCDPTSCIAYEGLRKTFTEIDRVTADFQTAHGHVRSGTFTETMYTNRNYQVLEEEVSDDGYRLVHIWEAALTDAASHTLNVVGKCNGDEAFQVSYAPRPDGPYTKAFVFDSAEDRGQNLELEVQGTMLYLKAEDIGRAAAAGAPSAFYVDDIWIVSTSDKSPFAGGDSKSSGWAETNFGLYGSSFVGVFGGIIETTNVPGILQLDCLATDYFAAASWPTFLYYNPYPEARTVEIDVGPEDKNVYDAIANSFLLTNVAGQASFTIDADSAVLAVVTPTQGTVHRRGNQLLIGDTVIDFMPDPM
ncbi:MAG: hypothetical protein JSW27_25385 [Phycisphaerales bacterium]|nr:MAG: hypothetical protein JSW27_25385 [Phycisphaerales bacterium]